ncbi:MAG: hypothetical protein E7378_00310 [Clostridiales bacterium]|nr:hypothetical protein [Clostridiales bacterium]
MFNFIRLKPARILSMDQSVRRRGITGVSSKTFGRKWFFMPEGKALFKTFDGSYSSSIANIRMLNEIICYKLAMQIGISCAQYIPANLVNHGKNYVGLASVDILQPNETFVTYKSFRKIPGYDFGFNLVDFSQILDIYVQNGVKIDKQEMLLDMYQKILFDVITFQTDRNITNYCLIINKKNKSYRPCPLFDNEFAFACDYLDTLDKPFIDFSDIVSTHSLFSKIFTIEYELASSKRYANIISDICFLAKKYPDMNLILKNTMKNLNIEQVFCELKNEGYEINDDYITYVCELVNKAKEMIAEAYKIKIPKQELQEYDRIS